MIDNLIGYKKRSPYEVIVKRGFDFFFSSVLIVVLLPILGIIALLVKLDDPKGTVLFRQTRIGRNGVHFVIYKFRSMKTETPNVATAKFENPENYITRFGKILRKSSLDELPQLFNVWKGEMSFIGPRPLIPDEEYVLNIRHQNGAENVLPGITGLAQVNGRDEISNDDKARLDGEYAQKICLILDMKIFFKTIFDVIRSKGIREGKQNV